MSETVENPSIISDHESGASPLANAKWELYARERALCSSRMVAYRAAGFDSVDDHTARGNAGKLERKPAMRDRIAWLCRQDEDVLQAARKRLWELKMSMINADIGDYYVMVQRVLLDKLGNAVLDGDGNQLTRMVQELKPFSEMTAEQRSIIQSLKYTDSGRPNLELYPKTWAIVELKKMLGIGPAAQSIGDEFGDMTLPELAQFIMREQAAIGIKELAKLASTGDRTSAR